MTEKKNVIIKINIQIQIYDLTSNIKIKDKQKKPNILNTV